MPLPTHYRQQLDDAEQRGYIDGYNDCHVQRPIFIAIIFTIIGIAIGTFL